MMSGGGRSKEQSRLEVPWASGQCKLATAENRSMSGQRNKPGPVRATQSHGAKPTRAPDSPAPGSDGWAKLGKVGKGTWDLEGPAQAKQRRRGDTIA